MLGLAVVVAIGLSLLTRQPAVFMLIPLAAVLLWFSRRGT
jgi:4-amino-4-deoxy-L-arabinose transferase-like glycosyltransferase